jgi:4'-phosphopantetheinyl transferase EntD
VSVHATETPSRTERVHLDAGILAGLFETGVVAVVARPEMEFAPLFPAEEASIPRAVAKRRREFTLGRACAREAMARFGVHHHALVPGPHRAPQWPDGLTGSITHCEGFCGAVVARLGRLHGIGIDAEPNQPFPPEIIRRVCTEPEVSHVEALAGASALAGVDGYRLVFSAKESVYKACYPVVQRVLEFAEVEVEIDVAGGRIAVRPLSASMAAALVGLELEGRFAITTSHVLTGATLVRSAPPARDMGHSEGGRVWSQLS